MPRKGLSPRSEVNKADQSLTNLMDAETVTTSFESAEEAATAITERINTELDMSIAYEKLQYPHNPGTGRALRKKEFFDNLVTNYGVHIPYSLRAATFAQLDRNKDGQIDFKNDFAFLYEGKKVPLLGDVSLASREAFAVDSLCRGFRATNQNPRELWQGQKSISFAEGIRRLQSVAPELAHQDFYPIFHRMGLNTNAEGGVLEADIFCEYFEPKLAVFENQPLTPRRPPSSKSKRSMGGTAVSRGNRIRVTLQTSKSAHLAVDTGHGDPMDRLAPDVINNLLLGRIDDMCTFVLLMDISPGMILSQMSNGLSRARFTASQIVNYLNEKVHVQCTNKMNLILFGHDLKVIKWHERSVRLTQDAVNLLEDFLNRHIEQRESELYDAQQKYTNTESPANMKTPKHTARILRAIIVDVIENDTVSEICLICALQGHSELATHPPCVLQDLKGRTLVKLVRSRQHGGTKYPSSPTHRLKSCVIPRNGGCAIIIHAAVIGPVADNAFDALARLTRAGNGNVRWINDDGQEMCQVTQTPRHHEIETRLHSLQGFWWTKEASPEADATKQTLRRVLLAVLKTSLPVDIAYSGFDANSDGVVSVGDFCKVVNAILSEEGHGHAKLTSKERFRLWRVFDTVDLGIVSIPRFVAVVRAAAPYLGLSVDGLLGNENIRDQVNEEMALIQNALSTTSSASGATSFNTRHSRPQTAAPRILVKDSTIGEDFSEERKTNNSENEDYDSDGDEHVPETNVEDEEYEEDYEDDDMHWLPSETDSSHVSGTVTVTSPSALLSSTTSNAKQLVPVPQPRRRSSIGSTVEIDPSTWRVDPVIWKVPCLEAKVLNTDRRVGSPFKRRASSFSSIAGQGLAWSIREQAKVASDSIAVTLAINAARERVRLGVSDTPGLLHARTAAYGHTELPESLILSPEVTSSSRWRRNISDQPPFGNTMDSFATFHALDMNEWLEREDANISGTGELRLAPPFIHHKSHLHGSTQYDEKLQSLRRSDRSRLRTCLLSVHLRQLIRAKELVGMHVVDIDDDNIIRRVSEVVSLPPLNPQDDVRIALELDETKIVELKDTSHGQNTIFHGKNAKGLQLVVPSDCVGLSDGERYVPPGASLSVARYWGPLQCYSVGTLQGGFGLPTSAITSVTLELPSFVPFAHELDLSNGVVEVGQGVQRETLPLTNRSIRNLPMRRFKGICIRSGRLGPSSKLLSFYKLDAKQSPTRDVVANQIIRMGSILARISSPDNTQSLWLTEVPPSWLNLDDLLTTCRTLWNNCRAYGACRTSSGRAELTLPQLSVHSGFIPVPGLPNARQSMSFTLDTAGCELMSYCGGSWAMAHPPMGDLQKTPSLLNPQLDRLVPEKEFSELYLDEDRFVFSKPLLCFLTNGEELMSAFLAGQDGWAQPVNPLGPGSVKAKASPVNDPSGPRLSIRTNLRMRSHHSRLRSPTKEFPEATSPPKIDRSSKATGTGAPLGNSGGAVALVAASGGPTLYRIPDGATTEECMVIIAQTIADTLRTTQLPTSLGQFFDALAEVCTTGSPTAGVPQALNRKALTSGLRRTLGIKMSWAQFDAVFNLLGGGSTEVSKERFVKGFKRRIMRLTDSALDADAPKDYSSFDASIAANAAASRSDRQWLRETLGHLVDSLEHGDELPAAMFPEGASAAEFVRYLTNLNSGLTKQDLYKLLSTVDTGFVRKLNSWVDFGNMLSAVYMERLRDLQTMRTLNPGVMRTRAIDFHVARIERMLRHQETTVYEMQMFKHNLPDNVLSTIYEADKLARKLNAMCTKLANPSLASLKRPNQRKQDLLNLQNLHNKVLEARKVAQEALEEFGARVDSAPQVSDDAAALAWDELSSPWLHVTFRAGMALRCASQGPFATLLQRAGVVSSDDRPVWEEDRDFRLNRLHNMLLRTEIRLARQDAAQRKTDQSNAATMLDFKDRQATRLVRIQWQPHGPIRPMSAQEAMSRSESAEPSLANSLQQVRDSSGRPQSSLVHSPMHLTVDARGISLANLQDLIADPLPPNPSNERESSLAKVQDLMGETESSTLDGTSIYIQPSATSSVTVSSADRSLEDKAFALTTNVKDNNELQNKSDSVVVEDESYSDAEFDDNTSD